MEPGELAFHIWGAEEPDPFNGVPLKVYAMLLPLGMCHGPVNRSRARYVLLELFPVLKSDPVSMFHNLSFM